MHKPADLAACVPMLPSPGLYEQTARRASANRDVSGIRKSGFRIFGLRVFFMVQGVGFRDGRTRGPKKY